MKRRTAALGTSIRPQDLANSRCYDQLPSDQVRFRTVVKIQQPGPRAAANGGADCVPLASVRAPTPPSLAVELSPVRTRRRPRCTFEPAHAALDAGEARRRSTGSKPSTLVVACADSHGFAMYELFKNGKAKSTPGNSITEGIGLGGPPGSTAGDDAVPGARTRQAVTGVLRPDTAAVKACASATPWLEHLPAPILAGRTSLDRRCKARSASPSELALPATRHQSPIRRTDVRSTLSGPAG